MNSISIDNHGIAYTINKNIELISVVMLLSTYYQRYPYLTTSYNFKYMEDILIYFSNYNTHPVVKEFDRLVDKGFTFDMPSAIVLFCDEELNLKKEIHHILKKTLGGIQISEIEQFLALLKEFEKTSCFRVFFENHNEYYVRVLEKNIERIPEIDFQQILTDYFGFALSNLEVILSISFGGIGFCISQYNKTSILLGTFKLDNQDPIVIDNTHFIDMVLHEFSHSYVNPIVDNYPLPAESIRKLYEHLDEGYRTQYGSGKSLLSEQIVRAVTARIITRCIDEEHGRELVKIDSRNNFIAVEPLYNFLQRNYEYGEKGRDNFEKIISCMIKDMTIILNRDI